MRLTYNDSSSATSYNNAWCVAATGDTVYVVWEDTRHINHDRNTEIYTKRSSDGGSSWGPDTRLTNNNASSDEPSVAASGSDVHVVWWDFRDGNYEIYYKGSTDWGLTWGPDTRLTNYFRDSYIPSVAASGSNIHVVWRDYRDGNWEIYTKRSSDGGTSWGPDTRLTNDSLSSRQPSVAASGGNVHVVWHDERDGNWEIYTKRSTDGGLFWGPDTKLTNDTAYSWYPSVAVSGSDVHVVWDESRDGNREIYTKRSTDGGLSWGADSRLTNDTARSYTPSVAVSGSNVHVVWWDTRDGPYEIHYKGSTDGGLSWGPDSRLTNNSAWSTFPSVAVSGSKVHVVWSESRDGNNEIYYKRNPTGNSGVEDSSPISLSPGPLVPWSVLPNPFTSFTALPGREAEGFVLYDISGRRVGVYRGDRIGKGLSAGVYFLRPEGRDAKPLRIVKLR